MLNRQQLKEYRLLRGVSQRDVAAYCDREITQQYVGYIEKGERPLTRNAHDQIVKGINAAYQAKKNGTYKRPPRVSKSKKKLAEEKAAAEISEIATDEE